MADHIRILSLGLTAIWQSWQSPVMTTTALVAPVTAGDYLGVKEVARIIGRPARTVTRWCNQAQLGKGPFVGLRMRRFGRPWEIYAPGLAALMNGEN